MLASALVEDTVALGITVHHTLRQRHPAKAVTAVTLIQGRSTLRLPVTRLSAVADLRNKDFSAASA